MNKNVSFTNVYHRKSKIVEEYSPTHPLTTLRQLIASKKKVRHLLWGYYYGGEYDVQDAFQDDP